MTTRHIVLALGLAAAAACDSKEEGVATAPPIGPTASILVTLNGTVVEPLESVGASMAALDAHDRSTGLRVSDATWQSSDTAVATVSAGIITGVSPGVATITASIGGVSGSAVAHVAWRSDTRLSVGSPRVFVEAGAHVQLFPALIRSSGQIGLSPRDIEWTSSNPLVARVDTAGVLTTFAVGTATLGLRYRGLVDSALVGAGSLTPGFGYFYSGDAVIYDSDYYDGRFWTPAPGMSFTTGGFASATWLPPYSTQPDLGWVGPNLPLRDAFVHIVSLDNLPCTVYAQAEVGFHFVGVGSPLIDCYDSRTRLYQSVRMELVAFRPGEFSGTYATIYPSAPAVTTSAGGIVQTSATRDSRSYALPGIPRDSVYWFVSPGDENVASCRTAPSDGSVSQAAVRVSCDPLPFAATQAAFAPLFYAMGFGANARHGAAPIGFAEVSHGAVTRKTVDGLDIATASTDAQSTDVVVSGAGLAAYDRVPAVLVTAVGLSSGTCGISEPSRATPTTVSFTVNCASGMSGFTLAVLY